MNITSLLTSKYGHMDIWWDGKNKAKQSQFGEDQYKTKDPRHKTKDTSLESEVWGLAMPATGRPGKEKNLPTAGFNG